MINEELYFVHAKEMQKKSVDSTLHIVSDPDKIKAFEEEHTDKFLGVISNDPYYFINLDVYEDVSGKLFRYCNIEYKNKGAAILPVIISKEKIYLLESHYRVFTSQRHLEIPRGFHDISDFSSKSTALRELKEETSMDHPTNMISLGSICTDTGLSNNTVDLYAAEYCCLSVSYEPKNLDEQEDIRGFKLLSEHQIMQMIADNTITDSFTMAAILRYKLICGNT